MNQDLVTDRTLDTTSNILDIDANILELLIRNFEFNFCFITEEILTRQESQKIQNSDLECVFNTLFITSTWAWKVISGLIFSPAGSKKDLRVLEYPSRACWVILCMPYESFMKKIMGFDMDKYSIGI